MKAEGRGRSALGRRLLLTGPQVAVVAVGRRRGALRAGLEVAEDSSAEAMALLHRSWRSAGVRLGRSLCSWLGSGVLNFLCGATEAAKPNALPSSAWCSSVKLYKKLVSANNMYIICG